MVQHIYQFPEGEKCEFTYSTPETALEFWGRVSEISPLFLVLIFLFSCTLLYKDLHSVMAFFFPLPHWKGKRWKILLSVYRVHPKNFMPVALYRHGVAGARGGGPGRGAVFR